MDKHLTDDCPESRNNLTANPDLLPGRTPDEPLAASNVSGIECEFRLCSQTIRHYQFGAVASFAVLHLASLGVFFVRFRWAYVALMAAMYAIRMFGVTAGYHRYFSHGSYKLNRVSQFAMAVLAQSSGTEERAVVGSTPPNSPLALRPAA